MCDYSLYVFRNRLACEGERLVAYRFSTGCIGFASPEELPAWSRKLGQSWLRQNWPALKGWLLPRLRTGPTAVCIAPGTRLRLDPVARELQREFDLNESEEVTFVESPGGEFTYRDSIRFSNGREASLQVLQPGQSAVVIRSTDEEDAADPVELNAAWL